MRNAEWSAGGLVRGWNHPRRGPHVQPIISPALAESYGGAATPPYREWVGRTSWSAVDSRLRTQRCMRSEASVTHVRPDRMERAP